MSSMLMSLHIESEYIFSVLIVHVFFSFLRRRNKFQTPVPPLYKQIKEMQPFCFRYLTEITTIANSSGFEITRDPK